MEIYEIISWTAFGFVPTLGALGILDMQLAKEGKRRQKAAKTELT